MTESVNRAAKLYEKTFGKQYITEGASLAQIGDAYEKAINQAETNFEKSLNNFGKEVATGLKKHFGTSTAFKVTDVQIDDVEKEWDITITSSDRSRELIISGDLSDMSYSVGVGWDTDFGVAEDAALPTVQGILTAVIELDEDMV